MKNIYKENNNKELKECKKCLNRYIKDTTVRGCYWCKYYNLISSINKINDCIATTINLNHFYFYFNEIYKDIIENNVNLQNIKKHYSFCRYLQKDEVCIVVKNSNLFNKDFISYK